MWPCAAGYGRPRRWGTQGELGTCHRGQEGAWQAEWRARELRVRAASTTVVGTSEVCQGDFGLEWRRLRWLSRGPRRRLCSVCVLCRSGMALAGRGEPRVGRGSCFQGGTVECSFMGLFGVILSRVCRSSTSDQGSNYVWTASVRVCGTTRPRWCTWGARAIVPVDGWLRKCSLLRLS